jgi:hypothetical protein
MVREFRKEVDRRISYQLDTKFGRTALAVQHYVTLFPYRKVVVVECHGRWMMKKNRVPHVSSVSFIGIVICNSGFAKCRWRLQYTYDTYVHAGREPRNDFLDYNNDNGQKMIYQFNNCLRRPLSYQCCQSHAPIDFVIVSYTTVGGILRRVVMVPNALDHRALRRFVR